MLNTIKNRKSVRTYSSISLTETDMTKVNNILQTAPRGPFGSKIKFSLIKREHHTQNKKIKLGTYGMILGAPYFLAGAVHRNETAELDFGFVFEHVILQLTKMGLATCWLGGTLNRNDYAEIMTLDSKQHVPCITPVGYPQKSQSIREKITRWSAKSDNRKPIDEIAFTNSFAQPLKMKNHYPLKTALELLRLAPSASNKQPWRLIITDSSVHFYLRRTALIRKLISGADLQMVDMGISMCHFAIGVARENTKGTWVQEEPHIQLPEKHEYVASFKM